MWKTTRGLIAISLLSAPALFAQVVETFPVDFGSPRFGEQPWIRGNLVVWQRYGKGDNPNTGVIQCKDITRLGGPVLTVVNSPANQSASLLLSETHLYRGSPRIISRDNTGCGVGKEDQVVALAESGRVVDTNKEHVFIRLGPPQLSYAARSLDAFADSAPGPSEVIARYRHRRETSRIEAASDKFFVWQDRQPGFFDTWKIYAKRIEDLFTPGAERLVIDTGMNGLGSFLDLHENLLVFQKAERINEPGEMNFPWGVYLLDLEAGGEPVAVTHGEEEPRVWPDWPAISEHYIVWARVEGFFSRTAYARRHAGGELLGEAFPIGPGGSWIKIDRNIAVWNGSTSFENGGVRHAAIMAAELDLPGADDVGDVNQDGALNLTDAVVILRFLFGDGWRPRLRLADADRSGAIELTDAVVILRYLFQGGERPGV